MHVARYNYAAQFDENIDDLTTSLRRILTRGEYVPSPEAAAFEGSFASFLGAAHARGVGSGTDALIIALRALGIGPGDEVITQANTFHATVAAIVFVGATPVLCDVDPETFLLDARSVAAALTATTRVLLPVHLYGKPTPMAPLMQLAEQHRLVVVEDAAQAAGAAIGGRRVGAIGAAGCFSFHPSKNLCAAANGGAIVTSDPELATLIDAHRTHGQLIQHEHLLVGVNSKLDAMQCAILGHKLPKLDAWNRRRAEIAAEYRAQLEDLDVSFQRADPDETHVYHQFVLRTPHRDALLHHLQERGVDAVVRYPVPIHLQPAFARFGWDRGQFPESERLARDLLCLPIRPDMSSAEFAYVVGEVRGFFDRRMARERRCARL